MRSEHQAQELVGEVQLVAVGAIINLHDLVQGDPVLAPVVGLGGAGGAWAAIWRACSSVPPFSR
jgi:hypothetical protein